MWPSIAFTAPPEMDAATYKRWKQGIHMLLQQISNDHDASIFANPVLKRDAPAYYQVILQPMDLKTVGKRLRDGSISTTAAFRRDMLLIFANAIMFNPPGSDVAHAAHRLVKVTEELIHVFEVSEAVE
jgi:bromodomain-containing protein 8